MLHRGLALLAVLASTPAHAALIEYSFIAEIDVLDPLVGQTLGVGIGDSISGGFYFDLGAPRTSFELCDTGTCVSDGDLVVDGARTTSTYDAGNVSLWATIGGRELGAQGVTLKIVDSPRGAYGFDEWELRMSTSQQELGAGLVTQSMRIRLDELYGAPLTDSGLQVPDIALFTRWPSDGNNRFIIDFFSDARGGFASHLTSLTPVSVPEPATLSLLVIGLPLLLKKRPDRSRANLPPSV